ncbi:hypothetical protein [Halobacillus sp. H74]|uniref:hypothetical protein n=1 Tax=Halobacillus sp. H74 TaxID=3457436 RepID=UPI003FCCC7A1
MYSWTIAYFATRCFDVQIDCKYQMENIIIPNRATKRTQSKHYEWSDFLKKQFLTTLFISISVFIIGCEESNGESTDQKPSNQNGEENSVEGNKIILVGTPNSNGEGPSVNMDYEISDSKKIVRAEDVIETAKKLRNPKIR